ncbi:hypothetical protein ACQUY5_26245 [Bacillus cereus]|uniref:hypothetical protein n=1 Tax=Bacillus cereus TaxID=1396 RepID=UPI003D17CC76
MSQTEVVEQNIKEGIEKCTTKLKELTGSKYSEQVEKVSEILEELLVFENKDEEYEMVDFLTHVTVCAYYNLFGKDIVVDRNREFGCESVEDAIACLHEIGGLSQTQQEEIERVGVNLLANIRQADSGSYIHQGYLDQDVQVMSSLLFPVVEEKSDLEEEIEKHPFIQKSVTRIIDSILDVYKKVLAGGFEIEQYFGVSTLDQSRGVARVTGGKGKGYESISLQILSHILSTEYRVNVSQERQFNVEEMLNSNTPIYYPMKIMEYVYGTISTVNIQDLIYESYKGGSGWDNYAKNYIRPNLQHFLNKGVKLIVEKEGLVEDGKLSFKDIIKDTELIKAGLERISRSMVTMAIIPELESSPSSNFEDWASIKIRMVESTDEKLPSNQKIMDNVINNIMDGVGNVGGGEYNISPETRTKGGAFDVVEYVHTFDAKMANIRPLFAYQVLDSLKEKGETVDWNNIVLGKGTDGTTVTSKEGSKVNFTKQLVHNIIAGSRSGKGVMTLNILSTAIASERPVFYLDRKPDMAALFADYVGVDNGTPNMFIVSGSAYSDSFDINGVLNYDAMSNKWRPRVPEWWDINSYKDELGDIVYYRAIIFTLGLLLLRLYASGSNKELFEALGGPDGIAVVLDEFTNFQTNFSSKKINPRGTNGLFSKSMLLSKGTLQELEKAKDILVDFPSMDGLKSNEKAKVREAQNLIKEIQDPKRAYCTDMLDNLDRTILKLNDAKNAGFKNAEEVMSDIFVIGQNVRINPLPNGELIFPRNQGKAGGLNASKDYNDTCVISTFLYNFSTDWFLGYNADYPEYMLANKPDSPSKARLTQEARNFVYYKGSRDAVMGNMQVSTLKSDGTFFKPYLILNNAKEPKPLSDDPSTRKAQCTTPEFQYVGGVIMLTGNEWDKIRKQNVDPKTDELRPEIGFFDYLTAMASSGGKQLDPRSSLMKSKTIADMVVHQMGYEGDYLDFLMDLRPEWNFSAQCLVDAFADPETFKSGKNRMATYIELFGGESKQSSNIDDGEDDEFEVGNEEELKSSNSSTVIAPNLNTGNDDDNFEEEDEEDNHKEDHEEVDIGTDMYRGTKQTEYTGEEPQMMPGMDVNPTPQTRSEKYGNTFNPNEGHNNGQGSIDDPFNTPLPTTNYINPNQVQAFNNVNDIPTSVLMEELEKRFPNLNHDEDIVKPYSQEVYGDSTKYSAFGETRMLRYHSEPLDIDRMKEEATNEQEYFTNYFDFCERLTKDIIKTYGGYDGIESLVVQDGGLIINNQKYSKKIPDIKLQGLPVDKIQQIQNANYAHIFNFAHLTKMKRLAHMSIDSKDFAVMKIRQDLGVRGEFSAVTIFKSVENLYYLSIGGQKFERNTLEEDIARSSNFFRSSRKRELVANDLDNWGTNSVNRSWDSTKNMYKRKGWGYKVGGTAMLGVTAVSGALVYGAKGMRGLTKGIKDLFKA